MFQLVCFVRQMLSLFFSSLHPQERMTSGGRTELELHLTPSPTEDQPLPSSSLLSPSDCAQLLSLHPSIRLLYPPPDCTQRTRHLVSEGLRYRLALVLFWVWTILCMKMFSAENLKNKNLIFFFFIFFSKSAAEEERCDLRIPLNIHPRASSASLRGPPEDDSAAPRRTAPRTSGRLGSVLSPDEQELRASVCFTEVSDASNVGNRPVMVTKK